MFFTFLILIAQTFIQAEFKNDLKENLIGHFFVCIIISIASWFCLITNWNIQLVKEGFGSYSSISIIIIAPILVNYLFIKYFYMEDDYSEENDKSSKSVKKRADTEKE